MDYPDLDHGFDDESGPWPYGWAVAICAGVIAFGLVVMIGGGTSTAGFFFGLLSFGVFGVLLGAGGVARTAPDLGDDPHASHSQGGGHA